ncbi:hypothetical protein E5D57_010902 [Metarhizium anisopliae]|nr:hypothetical protein E5D57_010902 [Metarhizium anisopliae]
MKSTQLVFVTFASLALAQGDRWGLPDKVMTQQEVSAMIKYWNVECQDRKRVDEFTPLCQKKGGCGKCKVFDIPDNLIGVRCEVGAENNASAGPQETPKAQKTELQFPPQAEDPF